MRQDLDPRFSVEVLLMNGKWQSAGRIKHNEFDSYAEAEAAIAATYDLAEYEDCIRIVRSFRSIVCRAKKTAPPKLAQVAPSYREKLDAMTPEELQSEASSYAEWLANKTRASGPGAAWDSGEAKICAILDQFVKRTA